MVIIRAEKSGVWAGEIESRNGTEVVLVNARRLWYWEGAASLSQLAQSGTSKPTECKFPETVDKVTLLHAFEILDVSPQGEKSINSVPVWTE